MVKTARKFVIARMVAAAIVLTEFVLVPPDGWVKTVRLRALPVHSGENVRNYVDASTEPRATQLTVPATVQRDGWESDVTGLAMRVSSVLIVRKFVAVVIMPRAIDSTGVAHACLDGLDQDVKKFAQLEGRMRSPITRSMYFTKTTIQLSYTLHQYSHHILWV